MHCNNIFWLVGTCVIVLLSGCCAARHTTAENTSALCSSMIGNFSAVILKGYNGKKEILKVSIDFGKNWAESQIPKHLLSSDNLDNKQWASQASFVSLTNSGTLLLATTKTLYNKAIMKQQAIFLFSSADYGKTWERLSANSTVFISPITSITSSESTEYIYVCSGRNVMMSSDFGISWSISLILGDSAADRDEVMIKTSQNEQYTYVISYSACFPETSVDCEEKYAGTVQMSSDFGRSWSQAAHSQLHIGNHRGQSLSTSSDGKQVLISYDLTTVLLSSDFGKSFVNIFAGSVPNPDSSVTYDCENDKAHTHKHECIFHEVLYVNAVAMSHNGHHIVVAATSKYSVELFIYSHDGGQSWSKIGSPVSELNNIIHMTIDDKGENIIGVLVDGTLVTIPNFDYLPMSDTTILEKD